jgi:hypothetical protein
VAAPGSRPTREGVVPVEGGATSRPGRAKLGAVPFRQGTTALPRHRAVTAAITATLVLSSALVTALPAGATASGKVLAKDLLPPSYAKKAGFTKVVLKPTSTSKTGNKSCPNGAQEVFEDASGQTGIIAEVVGCTNNKAAATLLASVKSGTGAASSSAPTKLGSTAIERTSDGSTYAVYWRRGALLELVGYATNVPATSATSTSTTVAAPPITTAQQALLVAAALAQDHQLH